MIQKTFSRLLSLTALAVSIAASPPHVAHGQDTAAVTVKVVKYAELAKAIRQNAGKVVVVDFWSDTCIPCKKNFPHLVEMSRKYAGQGLVVISVSVDPNPQTKETQETALAFLRARQATFTNLLLDEPEAFWAERLGVQSLPCVFVFNRDGKWRKFTGEDAKPEDVDKLVAEWLKPN
jgi:thioredoxin-like negative regulator of GroEL